MPAAVTEKEDSPLLTAEIPGIFARISAVIDDLEREFMDRNGHLPDLLNSGDIHLLAKQLKEAGAARNPFLAAPSEEALQKTDGILLEIRGAQHKSSLPDIPRQDWQDLHADFCSNQSNLNVYDCGHELIGRFLERYPEGSTSHEGEEPLFSALPSVLRSHAFHVLRGIAPRTSENQRQGMQAAQMKAFREACSSLVPEEYMLKEIARMNEISLKVRQLFGHLAGKKADTINYAIGDSIINPCSGPITYIRSAFSMFGNNLEALERFYALIGR